MVEPSYQMNMLFRDFIILWLREGLTSFNKDNSSNFSGEEKQDNGAFQGVYVLMICEKTLSEISHS